MLKHINNPVLSATIVSNTVLGKMTPECFERVHEIGPANDVVFMSRFHAHAEIQDDKSVTLTNWGENPTYVIRGNETHIIKTHAPEPKFALNDGDIISFGAPRMMNPKGLSRNGAQVENPYTFIYKIDEIDECDEVDEIDENSDSDCKFVDMGVMKKHLSCPICYKWLTKPRQLSCGHIFCKGCIRKWQTIRPSCPVCRNGDVKLTRCLVIENLIKDVCG